MKKVITRHGSQYSVRLGTTILSLHDSHVEAVRALREGVTDAKEEKEDNRREERDKDKRKSKGKKGGRKRRARDKDGGDTGASRREGQQSEHTRDTPESENEPNSL